MSQLTEAELTDLGVTFGDAPMVSRDARIFGGERITLGHNVRIDAFCLLSSGATGHIRFGSYIHIASGTRIYGEGGVDFADFSSASAASTLYSASDDYSGDVLMGPTLPPGYTNVDVRPIVLERFAAIGAHGLVLPGVTLGEGSVLGAMSMASRDLTPWTIHAGVPARPVRERRRGAIELGDRLMAERHAPE